jgi:hypothetical protein
VNASAPTQAVAKLGSPGAANATSATCPTGSAMTTFFVRPSAKRGKPSAMSAIRCARGGGRRIWSSISW